jgi:hypothetical protein
MYKINQSNYNLMRVGGTCVLEEETNLFLPLSTIFQLSNVKECMKECMFVWKCGSGCETIIVYGSSFIVFENNRPSEL